MKQRQPNDTATGTNANDTGRTIGTYTDGETQPPPANGGLTNRLTLSWNCRPRLRAERAIAAFATLLAAGSCWPAYQLGLAEGGIPEAGLIPLLILGATALQATYLTIRPPGDIPNEETNQPAHENETTPARKPIRDSGGWQHPILAALAVATYLLLLPSIGYLLSTVIFSLVLLRLAGFPRRWTAPAALTVTSCCYLLFDLALQVPFPTPLGV